MRCPLVGIDPKRHINNGQPSLHAHLLACAAPRKGEHVVHVGAGVGYYTAIMAEMVGPYGHVTAIEYEPDLAARAEKNLSGYVNVSMIQGDGASAPFEPADVIYVNAGTTKPADIWLDRLRDGGRLILPLTTDKGFRSAGPGPISRRGAVFLITRRGVNFLARWVSPVAIYPCAGMRDEVSEQALAAAFKGGLEASNTLAPHSESAGRALLAAVRGLEPDIRVVSRVTCHTAVLVTDCVTRRISEGEEFQTLRSSTWQFSGD